MTFASDIRKEVLLALKEFFSSRPELSNAAVDQSVGNKLISELNEKINELKNKHLKNERLAGVCQEKYKQFDTMVVKLSQEIDDLRREKLDSVKATEELKRRNIEANKTIEELRVKKSESDKVAELYKSRLENMTPRIGKIKEDIADIIGLVKDDPKLATQEGGANLNIPVYKGEKDNIENVRTTDDAENGSPRVRSAFNSTRGPHGSGTRLVSGEGRLSNIACSSSAAVDTIEILDSDDETKPDGASDVSNRRGSKRNRTGLVENLFACPNTKKKRDAHTRDDASVDSEDESLSDSAINELVASFKTRSDKWNHKSDMMRAFAEDEELCMNAVCALYRQQVKSKPRSKFSKKIGFSPVDSISGFGLAEYLIDGDKELRLRKSVSEVKKQRPDVIGECRRLAKSYIDKLFTIYRSGEDPLLGQ